MAGTVFHEHDESGLGRSIGVGSSRGSWACAAIIALGFWLGLGEAKAQAPIALPADQSNVNEPAPLTSQFVAPMPENGPYFFGLERATDRQPVARTPQEPRPLAGQQQLPYEPDPAEQGAPSLGHGVQFDDGTNVHLYGMADPNAPTVGGALNRRSSMGFLRELNAGVSANEQQFVYHGGVTIALLERDGFGIASRSLFGGAEYDDLNDRQFAYSGDIFGGFRLSTRYGEHWLKAGYFYDWQDSFFKQGPAAAGLFFANEAHPMTIDFALGFGGGDDILFAPERAELLQVADRDYQLRTGVFVNSNLHVGFSGNFIEFNTPGDYGQYWGVGGFTNVAFGNLRLGVDMTVGKGGVRGFANAAWMFGAPASAPATCMVDGQAWLMRPVNRDVSVRTRLTGLPPAGAVGNIGLVTGTVIFPPRLAVGGDQNGNGVIDPGDTFELDLRVTNTSPVFARNVSVGQNPRIIGNGATLEMDITGENFGDIPPGESRQTDRFSDLNIRIDPTAQPGDTFSVEFDLAADGEFGRVVLGPFVVGSIANGQAYTFGTGSLP